MASESAERSLEMEGGRRRKEQNEERIMDRGSRERQRERVRGRMEKINMVCTLRAGESAYHGTGRGRRVGVEKQKSTQSKFPRFVFLCSGRREKETWEQVKAEGGGQR